MENKSRRSLQSTGGRSKRSRSATPGPKGGKSAGGTKSRKSFGSKKSGGKYSKLKDADEIEMVEQGKVGGEFDMNMGPVVQAAQVGNNAVIRGHEIYADTTYIPNNQLRLMEIPMTSSLAFQKLLFYHGTYDILHTFLMVGGILHKANVREGELWLPIVSLAIIGLWIPLEYFRLRFGYRGNINETFSEIVAFLAFSNFFVLPLAGGPAIGIIEPPFLPHELTCLGLNIAFIIVEMVMGVVIMCRFYKTQSAAFYLRTAPILDKNFQKKYSGANDMMGGREIQLGMQKYDKEHDFLKPFKESDLMLRDPDYNNRLD